MKNWLVGLIIAVVWYGSYSFSEAQTCVSTAPTYQTINSACASGTLTAGAEWNASGTPAPTTGGAPPYTLSGSTYVIPAGHIVEIASSNFTLNYSLDVYGTLYVSGKLDMVAGATIIVRAGGLVTCCSSTYCGGSCGTCGASDKIAIGGTNVYCGSACGSVNGSFTGPSTLSSGGLPINLLAFDARQKNDIVELKWSTASEINFDHFQVEHSIDGENFSVLSKVAGHGTSYDRNDYSLIDTNPVIGKNYYRLKSIDFDGYTELFKTIGITYSAEGSFTIFPNPSDGNSIHYRLNYIPEGPFIIAVYDHLGNVISRTSPESISQAIELSRSLSSGVYYAKLITENSVKVERFIVR